jgi:hypothetical protein
MEGAIGGRDADALHPSAGWASQKVFVLCTRQESLGEFESWQGLRERIHNLDR